MDYVYMDQNRGKTRIFGPILAPKKYSKTNFDPDPANIFQIVALTVLIISKLKN